MSSRSSKRARAKTARALEAEEQSEDSPLSQSGRRSGKSSARVSRDGTPSRSTPASSRGASPAPVSARRSSGRKSTSSKMNGNVYSGNVSRAASRSSSVNSTPGKVPPLKLKLPKSEKKDGRGYNPAAVNYKESEYHYGSDFEEDDEEEVKYDDKSDDSNEGDDSDVSENASLDGSLIESDVELDFDSSAADVERPSTPVPFWLRTDEDIPEVVLPPSSEDMLIPNELLLQTCATYEVLRHFSTLLRLSPFRIEDFCAALNSEEQSNLLSEVHIALVRGLIRVEEKEGTQFGPMDLKDSMSCVLFFMDSLTWPETMKAYFQTEINSYARPLEIMEENTEYPLIMEKDNMVETRLEMLSLLCDHFLATSAVRDDIATDQVSAPEDHCRICHRLGDMVICESCSGTFHPQCLEPPLHEIPDEEWTCPVCIANEVHGVTDVTSDQESAGSLYRQEPLGFDRAGNKYWFVCRRVIVECRDGSVLYYTTVRQFQELIATLDPVIFEAELFEKIDQVREDIEAHMTVTENLTNQKKPSYRNSYLELQNAAIEKVQNSRKILADKIEADKKKAEDELVQKAKEEEEKKKAEEEAARELEEEKKRKEREDGLKRREESRGDSFQGGDLDDLEAAATTAAAQTASEDSKTNEQTANSKDSEKDSSTVVTTVTTTTTTISTTTTTEVKKDVEKPVETSIGAGVDKMMAEEDSRLRMTRRTAVAIDQGNLYFKLGQESGFKTYINQYTTNIAALSKAQAQEEKQKKTTLSHKFSLTEAAAFKWCGQIHGNRSNLIQTLRATMLALEAQLHIHFMHPNWSLLKKPWTGAVTNSVTPRDFARALTVLKCCIKPILMLGVWKEGQGHTRFSRITHQMREEKKKNEKREKKEKEEEDARLAPWMSHIKYAVGIKQRVAAALSKVRGEEYRAHGQNGWLWLSSTRNFSPTDARTVGLRAGPFRLAVKYTDTRDGSVKIVLMEPKAFQYLLNRQEQRQQKTEDGGDKSGVQDECETGVKAQERNKLEQALKNANLERQVPTPDMFEEVVNVEAALTNPNRILYPKVAKKCPVIDDFLTRRNQLKVLEEKRIVAKKATASAPGTPAPSGATVAAGTPNASGHVKAEVKDEAIDLEDTKTTAVSDDIKTEEKPNTPLQTFVDTAKKNIWAMISKLKEGGPPVNDTSADVKGDTLSCCAPSCVIVGKCGGNCYAPTALLNKRPDIKVEESEEQENIKPDGETGNEYKEAETFYKKVVSEARGQGLNVPFMSLFPNGRVEFCSKDDAVAKLQNLCKVLMIKKEEVDRDSSVGISNVDSSKTTTTTTSTTTSTTKTVEVTKVNGEVSDVKTSSVSNSTTSQTSTTVSANGSTSSTSASQSASVKQTASASSTQEGVKVEGKTEAEVTRIYSSTDSSGKLYLKRIQTVAESKAKGKVVKYPLAPHFYAKTRQKRNILLLAKHDIRRMARKAGKVNCEGFNYNGKSNNLTWPYPCPRPFFSTTWLYRTISAESIQTVAMQLRILWASIRWDDMEVRPPSTDGKHQVTSDSAICTTEILHHKNVGKFMENTQYFQRKVTIPLDVPKAVSRRDSTPIRSGLRKRKRETSPVRTEPEVLEHWIDEEKLELWEIRAYRERLERDKMAAMTRSRTGVVSKGPEKLDPAAEAKRRREEAQKEFAKRHEEQLKAKQARQESMEAQKAKMLAMQKSQTRVAGPGQVGSLIRPQIPSAGNINANTPTIIRRVRNPDGSTSLIRTPASAPIPSAAPQTKKVFVTKDGKIVGTQVVQINPTSTSTPTVATPTAVGQRIITPSGVVRTPLQMTSAAVSTSTNARPQLVQAATTSAGSTPAIAASAGTPVASGTPQKLQIVHTPDGKMQIGGLLPGQQVIRLPDGKLQIVTPQQQQVVQQTSSTAAGATPTGATTSNTPMKLTQPQPLSTASPNKVGLQQGQQVVYPGQTPTTPTSGQVIATPLAPGSQIPAGMEAFVSGGKTYCIPKATTQMAKLQAGGGVTQMIKAGQPTPVVQPKPQPQPASTPQPLTPVTPAAQTPQKQMVNVKPLGNNVVTFKGNQMIVSGPNVAEAQAVAKQLSSGAARLANLNGKQVLIFTTPVASPRTPAGVAQTNSLSPSPAVPSKPGGRVTSAGVTPTPAATSTSGVKTDSTNPAAQTVTAPSPSNVLTSQPQKMVTLTSGQVIKPVSPSVAVAPKAGEAKSVNQVEPKKEVKEEPSSDQSISSTPPQVTAQFVQTPQGPRIILQGIQCASIPKDQLVQLQQQVKVELLKAQAEAKRLGQVPPTKVTIDLPPSLQQYVNPPEIKEEVKTEPGTTIPTPQPPTTTTTTANSQNSNNPAGGPVIAIGENMSKRLGPRIPLPPPNMPVAPKVVLKGPNAAAVTPPAANSLVRPRLPQLSHSPPQIVVRGGAGGVINVVQKRTVLSPDANSQPPESLKSPPTPSIKDPPPPPPNENSVSKENEKFEVTPDYIQSAIQSALKAQNLSPETERKLMALQEHNKKEGEKVGQELETVKKPDGRGKWDRKTGGKNKVDSETGEPKEDGRGKWDRKTGGKNKVIDPETGEPLDDAWDPYADAKRAWAAKNRPRKTQATPKSSKADPNSAAAHVPSQNLMSPEEKKKQQLEAKLANMVQRHKDLLKKDIAAKRSLLERQLALDIQLEIEEIRAKSAPPPSATETSPTVRSPPPVFSPPPPPPSHTPATPAAAAPSSPGKKPAEKRKRKDSESTTTAAAPSGHGKSEAGSAKKRKRSGSTSAGGVAGGTKTSKSDKLHCICKTKYDPSKFYVGCDVCNEWFCGPCVKITESMSKKMREYICDDCTRAREGTDLYCLCRQPYDETQFYIGCEKCSEWYHGRCVGILQCEAEKIDEYNCPKCDPNSQYNRPNQKPLTTADYDLLKKLIKQLAANRSAEPFKIPVDPVTVPNYYKVVKMPMDLRTIEQRVKQHHYGKLSEFIGDVVRIFENCRFFNPPNSPIIKTAAALENFFAQKLALTRKQVEP